MEVRDYEYIVAIADQGSITRAAEQLFITQPALTKFLCPAGCWESRNNSCAGFVSAH